MRQRLVQYVWTSGVLVMVVSLAFIGIASCTMNTGDGHGDETEGEVLFTTAHLTSGGETLSCAQCHGADGSGGPDTDIRESSSSHLQSHAQGGGTHPDGVKYPEFTHEDFDAMAEFLGGTHSDDDDDDIDDLVGDPVHGEEIFQTALPTVDGVDLSCASCHRQDGTGAAGPSVLGQSAGHLREHAQGEGAHPEGIKYPEITDQEFADMAAFLAGDEQDHHD